MGVVACWSCDISATVTTLTLSIRSSPSFRLCAWQLPGAVRRAQHSGPGFMHHSLATTQSTPSPFFSPFTSSYLTFKLNQRLLIPSFILQQRILAMPVSPSSALSDTSQDHIPEVAEILHLKCKLAAAHQELDRARGGRPKKFS